MALDPQHHEPTRRLIGTTLLVLLVAIVLLGFGALFWIEAGIDRAVLAAAHGDIERMAAIAAIQSKESADRLAQLLNIVFGPVVTLIGSVTGYYFGTQNRKG